MSFVEFRIFDGVSGDLRPWISWLEDFFVQEKFTAAEKMNLAQSLLEGEAEAWFYRIQKTLIFYSWKELKDKLLLRFGDFADPDRIRLIAKRDRCLQEIREEARILRMKTTSIPATDSIRETETEAVVPTDTIPITNWTESRDSILAPTSLQEENFDQVLDGGLLKFGAGSEESSETVTESLETRASYQVPVSPLEPGLSFFSESLDVSQAWQSEIVSNNRVLSQAGVGCVKNKNNAHHVFDELFRMLHDPGGKKDDHSDDIFETEVDLDKVQRTQMACDAAIDVVGCDELGKVEKMCSKFQAKSDDNSENIEEAEVMSARDLNDSLEKEWDGSMNDPDVDILYGDLGDITFFDASTSKEQMNGIGVSSMVSASDSFVLVQEQETSQEDDFVVVNHAASTTTTNTLACNKESESEEMKIDSESESEETEYETDPWEGDEFGVAVDTNQEAFESNVSANGNDRCIKLTELDFHLSENHSQEKNNELLVFPRNLLLLEFFLFIHLEDKVCLSGASNRWCGWQIFDRGKKKIISEDVQNRLQNLKLTDTKLAAEYFGPFQVAERIGVVVFKDQPLPKIAAVLDSFAPVFVIVILVVVDRLSKAVQILGLKHPFKPGWVIGVINRES